MLTLVILPAINIVYIDGGRQEKGPKIVDVICKRSLALPNLSIFDAKLSNLIISIMSNDITKSMIFLIKSTI